MGKRLIHFGNLAASDMRIDNGRLLLNHTEYLCRRAQTLHTPLLKARELVRKKIVLNRFTPNKFPACELKFFIESLTISTTLLSQSLY
jgi:hypothetical protein